MEGRLASLGPALATLEKVLQMARQAPSGGDAQRALTPEEEELRGEVVRLRTELGVERQARASAAEVGVGLYSYNAAGGHVGALVVRHDCGPGAWALCNVHNTAVDACSQFVAQLWQDPGRGAEKGQVYRSQWG
jgi:hypothetical protein